MQTWTPHLDRRALYLHRRNPHRREQLAKQLKVGVDELTSRLNTLTAAAEEAGEPRTPDPLRPGHRTSWHAITSGTILDGAPFVRSKFGW